MQTIRNIVLSASVLALLCLPLALIGANHFGVSIPAIFDFGKERSQLEARTYTDRPPLSFKTLADGTFESSFEDWLSDKLPQRDNMMLINASVQRLGIASAAKLAGYSVYPTYYGSNTVHVDGDHAMILATPAKSTASSEANINRSVGVINSIAEDHPDLRYALLVPMRSQHLPFEPFTHLVENHIDENIIDSIIAQSVDSNVTFIEQGIYSLDDYSSMYSSTDHHWNVKGAYGAYAAIATAFGFADDLLVPTESVDFPVPDFYGSNARSGLDDSVVDSISDYMFDLPELTVTINGAEKQASSINGYDRYTAGKWNSERFTNRYAEYFHTDYAEIVIKNSVARDASLLIVGDSFTNAMERLFAAHYSTVYVYDPRKNSLTVGEYIDAHPDIDDVAFILSDTQFTAATPIVKR